MESQSNIPPVLILVNQSDDKPEKLFNDIKLWHYSKFILVDNDLERINQLAILIENKGKDVIILKDIEELEKLDENREFGFSLERLTVQVCK
ncbi:MULTISPECIES: hypothetical protein [Sphingobacterium]|uniref:Uncharacterized protein n=1 Tax=Sphingobacterium hotanense TaxID=649196 RepID=A0ABT7NNB8_9SPHI|nr:MULTISPECIES: hypothetical protein [Sphingobacterium]MDM1048733.1 hypothetical protein [Sphingobacterium hotanense]